jgi:menaquinone-specific isochorismate synthase
VTTPGTHAATAVEAGVPLWVRTVEVGDDAAAQVTADGEMAWLTATHEIAGWGTAVRIPVTDGPERFASAAAELERHIAAPDGDSGSTAATRPVAFCSFTFDERRRASVMVVPRLTVRRRAGRAWITAVSDRPVTPRDLALPAPAPTAGTGRVRYAGTTATEIAWIDAVDRAVRRIAAGEVEKVVLARDRMVYSHAPFVAGRLLRHLRVTFPSCFTFHVDGLVGASPELLIRRDGARVSSLVLAGTAPRGQDARHDAQVGDALLHSAKDLAEHAPAVASVRRALAPLATDLEVDAQPSLLRLANVQHLASHVSGTLDEPRNVLELAGRLHPTAAVGGTPTAAALAMIDELETIDRDRYAGPVGWVDTHGDGELAIALRCAQLSGTRARLFAGAGIVAGSLPERELEETRLKLRAMQSAFEQP